MHFYGSINYDGRAYSTLENGYYIITKKIDGSLMIHGSKLTTPLNYQPPGGKIQIIDNKLVAKRKNETITIIIINIILYYNIIDWSDNKIVLSRTEAEAIDIVLNILKTNINIKQIYREFPTVYGPIDIVIIDVNNIHHVIEVKRKTLYFNHYIQLTKYLTYFKNNNLKYIGYLAGTAISPKLQKIRNTLEKFETIIYTF